MDFDYYHSHIPLTNGADATFWVRDCDVERVVNHVPIKMVKMVVIPKYQLRFVVGCSL